MVFTVTRRYEHGTWQILKIKGKNAYLDKTHKCVYVLNLCDQYFCQTMTLRQELHIITTAVGFYLNIYEHLTIDPEKLCQLV